MSIQELYDWAKEKKVENYSIDIPASLLSSIGLPSGKTEDIEAIDHSERTVLLPFRITKMPKK